MLGQLTDGCGVAEQVRLKVGGQTEQAVLPSVEGRDPSVFISGVLWTGR